MLVLVQYLCNRGVQTRGCREGKVLFAGAREDFLIPVELFIKVDLGQIGQNPQIPYLQSGGD